MGGVEAAESGEEWERRAETLYLTREYAAAAADYERAYAAYRRTGAHMAAGRAARRVAWIMGNVLGDWAVQRGWLGRAVAILTDAGEDRPEHGWVLMLKGFTTPDPTTQEALLRQAVTVGRRFADPDIEFLALAYLGALLVLVDRVEEGLAYTDEALAALCAGELSELTTVDEILCGLFWVCELVNDVPRADQWVRAAQGHIRQRNVVAAFCRAHYGAILTAAGRWTEAETELIEAVACFDRGMSSRRDAGIVRLAALRLRQGRLEEAAELLAGMESHPDAVLTVAGLHLARGETAVARDLLERRTAGPEDEVPEVGETILVGPLLALLVDVHVAEGHLDGAQAVAGRLRRVAEGQQGPYLRAAAALAEGRVRAARGDAGARTVLQEALDGFARARMPMELAAAHLEMARALAERSPEVAVSEARSALEGFERLSAARHADAAGALLRSLGAPIRTGRKGAAALTRREAEVLQLVGAGLSNREIGERLYITRKTVEHHVGSVLSKLRLRNRAEAVAYVVREQMRR